MAGCCGVRILHWGPLIAFTIIGTITTFTVSCDLQWWPVSTVGGALNLAVFLMWNVLTIYNLLNAAFTGPGLVPLSWRPKNEEDTQYLQYCSLCEGYKAPRSHHCRKCGRCVMKMDHHCPWINNCVGHFNHASFTAFLFFAPCGCIHALFILIPAMYRALNRTSSLLDLTIPHVRLTHNVFIGSIFSVSLAVGVSVAVGVLFYLQTFYLRYGVAGTPLVYMGLSQFVMSMFSCGLALGVTVSVGGLFVCQMKSIIKNETGIESWIKDKASYREREEDEEEEFVFPYDLGRWRNTRMVLHWHRRPSLDGIWWPVREGSHQYALTVEQLKQKKEKLERSVPYLVGRAYSGAMCPVTMGCRVICLPPCSDEARLRLSEGDHVLVSRWKKHWMYGEKLLKNSTLKGPKRLRGWFPRKCALHELDIDVTTSDAVNSVHKLLETKKNE